MIARLLSRIARTWRRIWPHEVVDARRAWGRDVPVPSDAEGLEAERAAASRAMSEATCLAVADPDATNEAEVLALFEAMVPRMRVPNPRDGGV